MKRTKIVCTIGPATHTEEQLIALVKAGMNVCRLNFSHGTHEDHAELIKRIQAVRKKTGEPLAILQDLQGPKIRVGELPEGGVKLEAGQPVIFTTGTASAKKISVTYPMLHKDVQPGQRLLLDDGLLEVKVTEIKKQDVICEVITGGILTSHKGLNLPETKTSISAISEKDRDDLKFGVEQNVDWVALSFVRSADDVRELRSLMEGFVKELGKTEDAAIRIISKIEKPEALEHIDAIIEASDGIMVARGDLGIETAAAKVPIVQKDIIRKCLAAAKPVIVATQMLDSMIRNPRPTRAEVSDVANAVIDHADATMLSGETASGAYPIEAVRVMAETIEEAEASAYDDMPLQLQPGGDPEAGITNVASALARTRSAKAIFVATKSGNAARLVSRYRAEVPIYAATASDRVLHQLNLSWGVIPFYLAKTSSVSELITESIALLQKQKSIQAGDELIVCAGEPLGKSGYIDLVEVRKI